MVLTTIVEDPVMPNTVQIRTISRYHAAVFRSGIGLGSVNFCQNDLVADSSLGGGGGGGLSVENHRFFTALLVVVTGKSDGVLVVVVPQNDLAAIAARRWATIDREWRQEVTG